MKKLVDDLRPKKFEEVWGQPSAVSFLSNPIIDGQRERNILLHGQVGSGKTTLARIYAAALNCKAFDRQTGSPCGNCDTCERTQHHDESLFLELSATAFKNEDEFQKKIENISSKVCKGFRRIIFIDEAHALADLGRAVTSLLKPIEESPEGIIYPCDIGVG